jgi:hypothetical protein
MLLMFDRYLKNNAKNYRIDLVRIVIVEVRLPCKCCM